MKFYEICDVDVKNNGEYGDELLIWEGFNLEEALSKKAEALNDFDRKSNRDKQHSTIECRVYELPNDTDIEDEDELINAICDCGGYNEF